MKTKLSISRELGRIERRMKSRRKLSDYDRTMLAGARQALAWAMGDNAARPMTRVSPGRK